MLNWLYRFAERSHMLVVPGLFVVVNLVATFVGAAVSSSDLVRQELPFSHFLGTSLLFAFVPAYSMVMLVVLWRGTEKIAHQFASHAEQHAVRSLIVSTTEYQRWRIPILLIGLLFGFSQNELFVRQMLATGQYTAIDIVFVLQSGVLWLVITDIILWRVNVSIAVSRFARSLDIELLATRRFKPILKMATTDILVVAGAMAFMPLQSLDAEFRIGNYQAGAVVGVLAATALFFIPLLGVRRNILAARQRRIDELVTLRPSSPPATIESLELHLAHEDRIRAISGWPIDLQLAARIFGYVIIPPIAWVGAALVERLIGNL